MKITFYGAAQNVTGSKHLIESASGYKVLLDCGLHQGPRSEANRLNSTFPIDAKSIDSVILSHAHLDHCGMLPVLVKQGYQGKIHATNSTCEIAEYILLDSAKIQEQDTEYLNRHIQAGEPSHTALYTSADVEAVLPHFAPEDYANVSGKPIKLNHDVHLSLYEAGHILGSSIVFLKIKEDGRDTSVAFSGDLGGNSLVPMLKPREVIEENVETFIMEATYGSRTHAPLKDAEDKLENIVKQAVAKKGKILIPAFSLGRTQEIVYVLHKLTDERRIPRIPIYVDSPLSNLVTQVFQKHEEDFNLQTFTDFSRPDEDPLAFRNLTYISSVEESKALNTLHGPLIIISASGMMESGRILHHLTLNIENPNNFIVITGYQAYGTLGRRIHHGEDRVKILDKYYDVKAKVETINEFSAHADRNDLLSYVKTLKGLKRVVLVHSELEEAESFKALLKTELPGIDVHIPAMGESIEL